MLRKTKEKIDVDLLKPLPDSSTISDVAKQGSSLEPKFVGKAAEKVYSKSRQPNCALCQNHGVFVRTKGHKRYCPWKQCSCHKCNFTKYRRKVVASQIAARRAMIEDQEREREMNEEKVKDYTSFSYKEVPQQTSFFPTIPSQGHKRFETVASASLHSLFDPRDYFKDSKLTSLIGTTESAEAVYHMRQSVQTLNKMFSLPFETGYPLHRIQQDFDGNFKLAAAKIFEAQYGSRYCKQSHEKRDLYSSNLPFASYKQDFVPRFKF